MKSHWLLWQITIGAVLLVCGCSSTADVKTASKGIYDRMPFGLNESEARNELGDPFNTEAYDAIVDSPFLAAAQNPLSTFSIDVDTASYSNVRRFLNQRQIPPAGAVRIEEFINYFTYNYELPASHDSIAVSAEVTECPWNSQHQLARIALKAREISVDQRPTCNFVFLIDVSGSMNFANKLPLVQSALKMLVNRLGESDRVAIVVYAGASGVVLPSTTAERKSLITSTIDRLTAGGSTNGGAGIQLAYTVAAEHFIEGGVNRVILCTDGDFNVGVSSQSELIRLIEEKSRSGVFLSVLGFGMGNYKDSMMEKLADKGNGNYAYIDNEREASKVLVEQLSGTLMTVAKDVKVQVDFNSQALAGYRLIGYENRAMRAQDFKDDAKVAGEMGSGQTVTAFYELIPPGQSIPGTDIDPSKYQRPVELAEAASSGELFTVRIRYKEPEGQASQSLAFPVQADSKRFQDASSDFQFAACVAEFGMLLRESSYSGQWSLETVREVAAANLGLDVSGYRAEFLQLVTIARDLRHQSKNPAEHEAGSESTVLHDVRFKTRPQ